MGCENPTLILSVQLYKYKKMFNKDKYTYMIMPKGKSKLQNRCEAAYQRFKFGPSKYIYNTF